MAVVKEWTSIIEAELADYAKPGLNGWGYVAKSDDGKVYVVVDISIQKGKRYADSGLIVRVFNDLIIIEQDMNDKQLVDALVQAGIPREQIILAYAGEPIPEGVPDAAHYLVR
jgi:hypothetical protein